VLHRPFFSSFLTLVNTLVSRESTTDLLEGKEDIEYAAYEAALIQDQNAKLSVFATRPAVLNFPCNWLVCLRKCVEGSMHLILLPHHPRKRMSAILGPSA
jgi:hypothetical protein